MDNIVLDTNCLLASLSKQSIHRPVWDAFLAGQFILCISTEIIEEYAEIIAQKTTSQIADNVIKLILNRPNVRQLSPYFQFHLIESAPDDNKFVDCAIIAGARYIVSNDAHFRVLATIPFPTVDVITLDRFKEELERLK